MLLPEGYDSLTAFLSEHIVLKNQERLIAEDSKIAVKVEIGDENTISQATLIQGIGYCEECNEEFLRVLKMVPIHLMTITSSTKKPFIFSTYFQFGPRIK